MINYTFIKASLKEGKKNDYKEILEIIQKCYVSYNRTANGIEFEMQHSWNEKDFDTFISLSKEHPKVLIQLNVREMDASDFSNHISFFRHRYRNGEAETTEGEINYEPFEHILTEKEQTKPEKPDIEDLFETTLNTLKSIRESGYIPCSSLAPSSTEASIRKGIDKSLKYLESTLSLHRYLYKT